VSWAAHFELAGTAEVFAADPGAGLDLDGDYLTIVALKHEVGLVAGFGAEVPGGDRRIGPAGLLEHLPDSEGFEQVPVFGEGRRRGLSDLMRGKVQQPCHDAGIDEVYLRVLGDA